MMTVGDVGMRLRRENRAWQLLSSLRSRPNGNSRLYLRRVLRHFQRYRKVSAPYLHMQSASKAIDDGKGIVAMFREFQNERKATV